MVHFGESFWSLRSKSVTRQVSFNRTKIGGKCQNSNATFWVIFKQCDFAMTYIWALNYFALMRQNSKERKAFVRHTNDFARNDMVKPMQGKQLRWRIREMTSLSGDRFWNYKWLFVGLVLIYSKGSSLWTKGVFLLIIPYLYFQKNHKKAEILRNVVAPFVF